MFAGVSCVQRNFDTQLETRLGPKCKDCSDEHYGKDSGYRSTNNVLRAEHINALHPHVALRWSRISVIDIGSFQHSYLPIVVFGISRYKG